VTQTNENPFLKFWHWYTEGQNAWHIATSSGVTLFVAWVYPADWKTAIPWLVVIFAFSGTWCVVQLVREIFRKLHRWWKPSYVTVSVSSGIKATIRLTHKGPATTYWADGCIVELLNPEAANPAEQLFRCQMQFKGTEGAWETTLREDDWCHIVMGEICNIEGHGSVLAIRRGGQGQRTIIQDDGCVFDYTIWSKPRLKSGAITKQFVLVRNGNALQASEAEFPS
jgi:hypothetical protein